MEDGDNSHDGGGAPSPLVSVQAVNTKQNPPKFLTGTTYRNWKNKLRMWTCVTGYAKKEQAIIVLLTAFEGNVRAEKAASEFTADDLHNDNGLETLLKKLDNVFKSDQMDDAYEAYTRFNNWEKPPDMNMNDFVIEFEHRYHQMSEHDMKLPDCILAFRLVDASKIQSSERQLAFTIANDMKYSTMKSALRRIFASTSTETPDDMKPISVKAEAYYASRKSYPQKQFTRFDIKTKQYNPKNRYGEISRCNICDSKMHFADKCPHNQRTRSLHLTEDEDAPFCSRCQHVADEDQEPDSLEIVNAIFLAESRDSEIYVTETTGCAILDTACTKTVCGESWFNDYISDLDQEAEKSLKIQKGGTSFKFGDGRKVVSIKTAYLPAVLAGLPCHIKADVVKDQLPLLLSKTSLKKAGTKIDLENDRAIMLGKLVELQFTTNGHYCINIHPNRVQEVAPDSLGNHSAPVLISTDAGEMKKQIVKLHKQFGHASQENLLRLLRKEKGSLEPGVAEMVKNITTECETCTLLRKPPPRPVVGLPRAQDVNETVALDLHQLGPNLWYLHMVDEFSKFSSAAIISSKAPKVIVQKFLQSWVSIMGAPKKIISDNGGEFNNEVFRDMCENFNIAVMTTPAFSPWSNGICERHNQFLTEILMKVKKDTNCNWETALAWAISAKNSLINNSGFSPIQIVFGRGINLPSVLTDKLPALEGTTMSAKVGEHIMALHSARRAFIQAESSEKIRRALRSNVRPFIGRYQIGEEVYYKRSDNKEWRGPAKVLGQDGVLIFLRHGGQLIRAHASRVQRIKSNTTEESATNEEKTEGNENEIVEYGTDDDDCEEQGIISQQNERSAEVHDDPEETVPAGGVEEIASQKDAQKPHQSKPYDGIMLKKSEVVSFETGEKRFEAEVISRAGKATGKYRNCFNVEYRSPNELRGSRECVDFGKVTELRIIRTDQSMANADINSNEQQTLLVENIDFTEAKEKELSSWKENQVFLEGDYQGQKCISVRWVCSLKKTGNGIEPKARLVARGFEDPDIENVQKDSPTCSKDALRTIIAITAQKQWQLHSIDIKTAFLQGEPLDRDVFLMPPKEAQCSPGIIWKLRKCVYGLTDASLQWYDRVRNFMTKNNGKITKCDPAVFCWHTNGKLWGVVAVHVDDFLWAGEKEFEETIIHELRKTFKIGAEESGNFKYLGLEMQHNEQEMLISQSQYISELSLIEIDREKKKEEAISTREREILRSKIGQLLWISTQTRPDIAFDVCSLAINFKHASQKDLFHANKVVRKLKSEEFGLRFQNLGPNDNLKLVCYTDASFANLSDGGSQSGTLIFLVGTNNKCNLLSWESKRIKRVVKSTLAAETLALSSGIDTASFVASLFSEIWNGDLCSRQLPIDLVVDNHSLFEAVKSTKQVLDKRLRVDVAMVREMVKRKEIANVYWVDGKLQLADCLTKSGASSAKMMRVLRDGLI